MRIKFPHLQVYRDDHGTDYAYYRRAGRPKVRIREPHADTPEFAAAYYEAKAISESGAPTLLSVPSLKPRPDTFRWLCVEYFQSLDFRQLDPDTQRVRRRVLEACWDEPWQAGSPLVFGEAPLRRMDATALEVLRDRKLPQFPEAARNRLKNTSQVFAWAVSKRLVRHNPARDVTYPKSRPTAGFHSWSRSEVEAFEVRHPIGSKARLALALLIYTGQRGSDVHLFGPQHVNDGWLRFTQQKNVGRNPVRLELPMLPILAETIKASAEIVGPSTFLVTGHGHPFSHKGFGQWFRKCCDEAGLPQCTAHGLRKAGAVIAAENGATAHQLMSIFGWRTIKEAERYTKAAEQKRIAGEAMPLLLVRKRTTSSD
jgi:integrase